MFGILSPCSARTPLELRPRWMGHFCGLCLNLRDDAGHVGRLATNYDALALSVLVEAQSQHSSQRTAGPCALRGMRSQAVTTGAGPALAAVASLLLVSAKLRDHVDDGDGFAARGGLGRITRKTSGRIRDRATKLGGPLGLDVAGLDTVIAQQPGIEAAADVGTPLTVITAPTETVTGALFAHSAVLAGRPDNVDALRDSGRAFGRLAHLIDAVGDQAADSARGAWNPLTATGATMESAREVLRQALAQLRAGLSAATFTDRAMVDLLLNDYTHHAVDRSLHRRHGPGDGYPHPSTDPINGAYGPRKPEPRGFWAGLCAAVGLCVTCRWCCCEKFEGPWSRRERTGCCHKCECGDLGCGNCCSCDCG